MNQHAVASLAAPRPKPHADRHRPPPRRGVSSVLAMMFLVIFGSLTAAMAVVAQGNLRTADSAMKVSQAMSAAETGLVFASRRLASESSRFVVEKGVIDWDFGHDLWLGTYDQGVDGAVEVLPPVGYVEGGAPPVGVVEAVRNAHLADSHDIIVDEGLDPSLPDIDEFGTLRVRPIALASNPDGTPNEDGPYFRLKYELIADAPYLRITSQGVDGQITRTLQMDFRINKKIEYAVISPNRIMIGKNVRVEGPLGSRYGLVAGELDTANGDPLVMRSDFYYLDAALDLKLDTFFAQIALYDDDGDARLRPDHPIEVQGVNASADHIDYDLDEYVDDFDLFLAHFDADGNGGVVYDTLLANAAGLGMLPEEFADIDDQLARLIDEANADRDGDGEVTPCDGLGSESDCHLGYQDGVIDANDLYAKVRGRLLFAVARADWEAAHGESYQTIVQGPVRPGLDEAPVIFEASDEDLREMTTDMFSDSQTWFDTEATDTFQAQVDAQDGVGDALYIPPSADTWEDVPYGAEAAGGAPYDYYQRPIYQNMTFGNVRVPMDTNAVFDNCTFIGVTYIETDVDCIHENWNYAGALQRIENPPGSGNYTYEPKYPGLTATNGAGTWADTRVRSNNIRFHNCTFIGSIAGVKPEEYTHWRNKLQLTGQTRFYIDPDDRDLAQQPDAQEIQDIINAMDPADIEELSKSSVLMTGWSVDVGNFTNEQAPDPSQTAKVKLKGTIVAGILDIRGTADVHGTLLMTFRAITGEGPLFYGGLTDAFNTTIGYFGPSDGDGEGADPGDATFVGFGEITLRYDPDAKLPDGIPWPIVIEADPITYTEGGSM